MATQPAKPKLNEAEVATDEGMVKLLKKQESRRKKGEKLLIDHRHDATDLYRGVVGLGLWHISRLRSPYWVGGTALAAGTTYYARTLVHTNDLNSISRGEQLDSGLGLLGFGYFAGKHFYQKKHPPTTPRVRFTFPPGLMAMTSLFVAVYMGYNDYKLRYTHYGSYAQKAMDHPEPYLPPEPQPQNTLLGRDLKPEYDRAVKASLRKEAERAKLLQQQSELQASQQAAAAAAATTATQKQ
eukprot:gnl/Hemi2/9860_TR3434_c0_g1_i1.p1 gnl/Hemi2/9860_TR3434_c0_g1~~gnl/Hemi2/9860_TR3434_c0_g1_i1.p1  ORF type:complete len:240 (-),score=46.19 gnl/Hemi2/9860_TR3434_c0_g1_i1:66-785(-)